MTHTEPLPLTAEAMFARLVELHQAGDDDGGAALIQAWIDAHWHEGQYGDLLALVEAGVIKACKIQAYLDNVIADTRLS